MSFLRADGLQLERVVTMADIREVHEGGKFGVKHRFCLACKNTMAVTRYEKNAPGVAGFIGARETSRSMRPVQEPCRAGMQQFAEETRGRVAEGPHGETWWIASAAPEQWALTNMWIDERLEWAHWMDFRLQSRLLGMLWRHRQQLQLAEAERRVRAELAVRAA